MSKINMNAILCIYVRLRDGKYESSFNRSKLVLRQIRQKTSLSGYQSE